MPNPKLSFQHDAFLGALERRFLERIETETQALVSGRCGDQTDYKVRVAVRKAWLDAIDDIAAVAKTYLDEDDDE